MPLRREDTKNCEIAFRATWRLCALAAKKAETNLFTLNILK
jgi:hypothetical protein